MFGHQDHYRMNEIKRSGYHSDLVPRANKPHTFREANVTSSSPKYDEEGVELAEVEIIS